MRSSADSMPTESRISVGGTANGASAVDACVIRAGCSMRLSTPPRLSASFQIFVRATSVDGLLLVLEEERDHPAEVPHLPRGDRVAGVRRQAGVEDARDARVPLEEGGDRGGVRAVPIHPHGERLHAAQHEPRVERPGYRAERLLQEREPLGESRRRSSRRSRR